MTGSLVERAWCEAAFLLIESVALSVIVSFTFVKFIIDFFVDNPV